MLRITRSPAFQRQLLTCAISTSRTLLMALQTAKPSLTSLNAAAVAHLDLKETLEEAASSHFSESSAFPEFSPMEDTLLSTVVPLTPDKIPMMDSHAMAQEELNEVMQKHFCASSDFPEYSAAEEECMMHEKE